MMLPYDILFFILFYFYKCHEIIDGLEHLLLTSYHLDLDSQ